MPANWILLFRRRLNKNANQYTEHSYFFVFLLIKKSDMCRYIFYNHCCQEVSKKKVRFY